MIVSVTTSSWLSGVVQRMSVLSFVLVTLTPICTKVRAQDMTLYNIPIPVHAVKLSPFHVLNFYPTIQVAYEHKVGMRSTIQLDAGCVLNDRNSDSRKFHRKRGVKLKTEWRYYYGERAARNVLFYGAIESYYNIINFNRTKSVIECFDEDCTQQYERRYPAYKVKYREPGLNLKWGFVKYYSKLLFDINLGISYRYVVYKQPRYIPDTNVLLFVDDEGPLFDIPNEKTRLGVSPVLGIRFGYRIK